MLMAVVAVVVLDGIAFPNPGASAGYLTIPLHPVIRPFSRRHVPQSPESRHKLRL